MQLNTSDTQRSAAGVEQSLKCHKLINKVDVINRFTCFLRSRQPAFLVGGSILYYSQGHGDGLRHHPHQTANNTRHYLASSPFGSSPNHFCGAPCISHQFPRIALTLLLREKEEPECLHFYFPKAPFRGKWMGVKSLTRRTSLFDASSFSGIR